MQTPYLVENANIAGLEGVDGGGPRVVGQKPVLAKVLALYRGKVDSGAVDEKTKQVEVGVERITHAIHGESVPTRFPTTVPSESTTSTLPLTCHQRADKRGGLGAGL